MRNKQLTYFFILGLHLVLGFLVFAVPPLAKVYGLAIPLFGTIYVINTQNRNNEVLLVAAYIVSSEVFLRMTEGNLVHEIAKYEVIYFMILGMFYRGFSKKGLIFMLFLLLLIPGIIKGATEMSFGINVRKAILFNILGPVCLGVSALYCYKRMLTFSDLHRILVFLGFPIVSLITYITVKTPNVKDIVTGTASNFQTSGGFGPNQVSTVLGLGMIVFFALLLLFSKTKKEMIIHGILLFLASFRGIVTFSRGGVITGAVAIILLLLVVYYYSTSATKGKIMMLMLVFGLGGVGIWGYSSYQTNGMIEYRYANQDAAGRVKKDRLGGREEISQIELKLFLENPVTGIGVGKGKEYREEEMGQVVASHNEITRMLAEQGMLGVICLLILLAVPLLLYFNNKQHLLLLSFYIFWLLTINHAAMRIAAPSFIYALSLLKINFLNEETTVTVHREPAV